MLFTYKTELIRFLFSFNFMENSLALGSCDKNFSCVALVEPICRSELVTVQATSTYCQCPLLLHSLLAPSSLWPLQCRQHAGAARQTGLPFLSSSPWSNGKDDTNIVSCRIKTCYEKSHRWWHLSRALEKEWVFARRGGLQRKKTFSAMRQVFGEGNSSLRLGCGLETGSM